MKTQVSRFATVVHITHSTIVILITTQIQLVKMQMVSHQNLPAAQAMYLMDASPTVIVMMAGIFMQKKQRVQLELSPSETVFHLKMVR